MYQFILREISKCTEALSEDAVEKISVEKLVHRLTIHVKMWCRTYANCEIALTSVMDVTNELY